MSTEDQKLKNNLKHSDRDSLDNYLSKRTAGSDNPKVDTNSDRIVSKVLLIAVIIVTGLYFAKDLSSITFNPVSSFVNSITFPINQPSEDLLNRMGARMVEMGYTGLTHDDLRELRSQGVTATYISNVRALGFTDLTLDESVLLANANVTSTFMAMMMELGYELDIEDFILLRRAGVTAHYTSNIHDLGFTDVTPEQLIRMRSIGVTPSLIERLQREEGSDISLDQIIRFRISNQ